MGYRLISLIIEEAIEQNRICACKVITVDAYAASLSFYEKAGFKYFSNKDQLKDTRQMYLNLTSLVPSNDLQEQPSKLALASGVTLMLDNIGTS